MDRKKKLQGIVMLLIVTMIWGSGFIATEYAIRSEMPTAWIMAIRFCVGALLTNVLKLLFMIFIYYRCKALDLEKAE